MTETNTTLHPLEGEFVKFESDTVLVELVEDNFAFVTYSDGGEEQVPVSALLPVSSVPAGFFNHS